MISFFFGGGRGGGAFEKLCKGDREMKTQLCVCTQNRRKHYESRASNSSNVCCTYGSSSRRSDLRSQECDHSGNSTKCNVASCCTWKTPNRCMLGKLTCKITKAEKQVTMGISWTDITLVSSKIQYSRYKETTPPLSLSISITKQTWLTGHDENHKYTHDCGQNIWRAYAQHMGKVAHMLQHIGHWKKILCCLTCGDIKKEHMDDAVTYGEHTGIYAHTKLCVLAWI